MNVTLGLMPPEAPILSACNKQPKGIIERGGIRININTEDISYRSGNITMSASLGFVLFDYKSEESADSLILKADDYMYMAKRKRNSVYHIKCQ
jgi:GGDEF domain-containing protein